MISIVYFHNNQLVNECTVERNDSIKRNSLPAEKFSVPSSKNIAKILNKFSQASLKKVKLLNPTESMENLL